MNAAPLVIFVRGCARSGTTLLADLMNESPRIGLFVEQPLGDVAARVSDIFWFEKHIDERNVAIETMQNAASKKRAAGSHFAIFENMDRLRFPRRYPTRERLGAIVTGVVEASLDKRDLYAIGSKTPGHWDDFELEIITSSFPRVKYVFIVRNPLETVNSIINFRNRARAGLHRWPDKPIEEAIARYQEAICLLLSCARELGDECYVIGYDDLIADPATTLAALGDFLNVELRDFSNLVGAPMQSKNVLTPDEETKVQAAFGAAIQAWPQKRLTGLASALGDNLDDCLRVVRIGTTYRCDAPVGDRGFLGSGWSGAEPPGIWSDAPHADIFFTVPQTARYAVALTFAGYVPSRKEPLEVWLTIDGRRFPLVLRNGRKTTFRSEPLEFAAATAHRISFDFNGLRSPLERGLGADRRRLGICLRRFAVEARRF